MFVLCYVLYVDTKYWTIKYGSLLLIFSKAQIKLIVNIIIQCISGKCMYKGMRKGDVERAQDLCAGNTVEAFVT